MCRGQTLEPVRRRHSKKEKTGNAKCHSFFFPLLLNCCHCSCPRGSRGVCGGGLWREQHLIGSFTSPLGHQLVVSLILWTLQALKSQVLVSVWTATSLGYNKHQMHHQCPRHLDIVHAVLIMGPPSLSPNPPPPTQKKKLGNNIKL